MDPIEKAYKIKKAHETELMSKPNVIGVGVGLKTKDGIQTEITSLIILVSKKLPKIELSVEDLVPDEIEGIPIDVMEVGQIKTEP